jgi:nitrogen regulatory protein PII
MKEVKAYIRPHKLAEVAYELREIDELSGMSFHEVHGFGRERARNASHKIVRDMVHFAPYVRIEILCKDELAEKIVAVVQQYGHEGLKGGGKIVVSNVEKAIRISTGESGDDAL